jgi:hypothetical protein
LQLLWSQNITITTRLVDTVTTAMPLKTVQSKKLDPTQLITHHFRLDQIIEVYDTFGRAADTQAPNWQSTPRRQARQHKSSSRPEGAHTAYSLPRSHRRHFRRLSKWYGARAP